MRETVRMKNRHAEIRSKLAQKGSSLSVIVHKLKVSKAALTLVSMGKSRSSRIEQAIAEGIGMTPQDLFPEYYQPAWPQKEEADMKDT